MRRKLLFCIQRLFSQDEVHWSEDAQPASLHEILCGLNQQAVNLRGLRMLAVIVS
jgi:hypothetical protein